MKLWQLVSVSRSDPAVLDQIPQDPRWSPYGDWFRRFNELVRNQEREKLDAELPDDLVIEVLRGVPDVYFLSSDYVRTMRQALEDRELSALEVFERFGGDVLEEVGERGAVRVTDAH